MMRSQGLHLGDESPLALPITHNENMAAAEAH
jgi:hypothetical protein